MEPKAIDPAKVQSDSPSDGMLVGRVLHGDRTSFDHLTTRYQRQAVAVAYRLLGNSQDAQEVAQDSFLKAFSSLASLQKPEAFGGWLMRIVSNLSLNYRRSRKLRQQQPLDETLTKAESQQVESMGSAWMDQDNNPVHTMESRELGQQLQQALEQLPEKQRLAIVLFTIQEMPQKDVAEALGCSVEAVKWHVFQGRKKLKELMKEYL